MKVLVLVSCFPPSNGGVERASFNLAMGLAEAGHSVTVYTSSRGKEQREYVEQMGPLKVIRYPEVRHLFEAPIIPRIALAALTEDYDVLHVHGMTPSITDIAILLAKLRRKPVVLTYHNDAQATLPGFAGYLAEIIYSKLALAVIHLADFIVSSTHSYAATSPVLKHVIRRVTIVPWGTDTSRFNHQVESLPNRPQKRLLFVGQLKDYKGLHVLLESLARLRNAGRQIIADIVGTGPAFETLRSRASELTVDNIVKFWGTVADEELPELFRQCDVVALPSISRREAFGLVLLDAFAAGKPVVASDIPGVSEVASLGRGYLARPNDALSLADCISRAVDSPNQMESLRTVAQTFTWKRVLVKYEALLRYAAESAAFCVFYLLITFIWGVPLPTGNLGSPSTSHGLATLLS